jgi:hypothetical protein
VNPRILDVLPVQATLVPEILLKLFFNEAHHGQPAGVWGEDMWSEIRDHRAGKGTRLGGVGRSFFASTKASRASDGGIGKPSRSTGHSRPGGLD